MNIRLVDTGWREEFNGALCADSSEFRIICPYIKFGTIDYYLDCRQKIFQVTTKFNLAEFLATVSDVERLRKLLTAGAKI